MPYVLVHGGWGRPSDWDLVMAELGPDDGAIAVDLPTGQSPNATLGDDVDHLLDVIDSTPGDVVLVGHSYGGMVITGAGNHERVSHLVYLCAFMPDVDETVLDWLRAVPNPSEEPGYEARDDGSFVLIDWDSDERLADYAPEARLRIRAAGARRPFSGVAAVAPAPTIAWQRTPSTYVVATRDSTLPSSLQRTMAKRATNVFEVDAAHLVAREIPGEIAALLRKIPRA